MTVSQPSGASGYWLLAPIVLGLAISAFVLNAVARIENTNFEELALAQNQATHFASVAGNRVHCADLNDADLCFEGLESSDYSELVLWFGNSQLHTVNNITDEKLTAPRVLFESLSEAGKYLLTFSQPNANLREHYLLFEYLRGQVDIDVLILPVFFDDLREHGIREGIASARSSLATVARLQATDAGQQLLDEASRALTAGGDLSALDQTIQENSERFLVDALDRHSPTWRARPELRGRFFTALIRLRNSVFGITATSKRKMIPGVYDANLRALEALLGVAKAENITVLIMVPPIRSDIALPYDEDEYRRFKVELSAIAAKHDATFANFERLIPGPLWGEKASTTVGGVSEPDFMHFTEAGHRYLAEEVYAQLQPLLGTRMQRSP